MNLHSLSNLLLLFPVVVIGFILPWLGQSRRGLLFGVTVSLEFASSAEALAALRRYRYSVLLVAALCGMTYLVLLGTQTVPWIRNVAPAAVALELVAAMVLWQKERLRMLPHAIVVPLERSAALAPRHTFGAMVASASALLPLAMTALWLHTHWSQLPARWPQHWNAAGQIDGWGAHTTVGVYLPLGMGVLVVALFVAIQGFLAYAPGTQSGQRVQILIPMAALGWIASLFSCTTALLPLLHELSAGRLVIVFVLQLVLILGVVVWMVVRGGFLPSATAAKPAEPYDGTDDRFWHGGLVYYNPADAAVLVPKRYGWGWTVNFARPAAWIFLGAIVLFVTLAICLPHFMK